MPHVLIVEDDLIIADMLQESLEASGYAVTAVARTVDEALRAAEQDPPDFAVIDVHLANGGFGGEVASALRTTSKPGIIYSTGSEDVDLTSLDGDALMIKPYLMRDVATGLKIIQEMASIGATTRALPRNFQLLARRP
jgi:DNA-binding response OmpR family regulator